MRRGFDAILAAAHEAANDAWQRAVEEQAKRRAAAEQAQPVDAQLAWRVEEEQARRAAEEEEKERACRPPSPRPRPESTR